MTKIKSCTCANTYQDEKYGEGRRVCNSTAKTKGGQDHRGDNRVYRCTSCTKEI